MSEHKRVFELAIFVLFCLSVVGFLIGTREVTPQTTEVIENPMPPVHNARQAVSYNEMHNIDFKANAHWKNHLNKLQQRNTPAIKIKTHERRAYAGAPPTVPHPIIQQSSTSCLACHELGIRVADRTASKISHPHYSNCTQCHVENNNSLLEDSPVFKNHFRGLKETMKGSRASPVAPPTIPHSTWMRNDCLSCHGLKGNRAIRTTHPERKNCFQCHALTNDKDQGPSIGVVK